jgi:hypothetical protein
VEAVQREQAGERVIAWARRLGRGEEGGDLATVEPEPRRLVADLRPPDANGAARDHALIDRVGVEPGQG